MITLEEAAAKRAENMRARADRPQQRRSAEWSGSGSRVAFRAAMTVQRAAGESGRVGFLGIASATEQAYEMYDFFGPFTEIVSAGAFRDTLAQPDLDVPLVLGHDQMRRIARTTNGSLALRETDAGLEVSAPDLNVSDADVAYILPKLEAGLVDEMSFAFRIKAGQWSPDYTEYRINAVDIHRGDVSIVGFGANPHTSGSLVTHDAQPAERRTGITRAAFDALYML